MRVVPHPCGADGELDTDVVLALFRAGDTHLEQVYHDVHDVRTSNQDHKRGRRPLRGKRTDATCRALRFAFFLAASASAPAASTAAFGHQCAGRAITESV